MTKAPSRIIGRWRIVEADLWDRDYLDLCGPAMLVIGVDGRGEVAYGAMQASLDIAYGANAIDFTWLGFDEMDEVQGSGSAELQEDGSINIEIAYHLGDEAILKAVREPSSTACSHVRLQVFRRNLLFRVGGHKRFGCARQETEPEDAG